MQRRTITQAELDADLGIAAATQRAMAKGKAEDAAREQRKPKR